MLHGVRSALDPATTGNVPATGINKFTHMQELDELAARHFRATQTAAISVSGRHLPLLYTLIDNLVSPPYSHTLLIIDLDGRFDVTRLSCTYENLRHVYVQRPARSSADHLRALVSEADNFMLYGDGAHASAARPWWGTVVVGGLGAGDIVAGWKGWLRIDREPVRSFTLGMSAQEALEQRAQRQDAVDSAGWAATSQWGSFVFREGKDRDAEHR